MSVSTQSRIGTELPAGNLSGEVGRGQIAEIKGAVHRHGMVFCRGQELTDDDLIALALGFGEVSMGKMRMYGVDGSGIFRITNVGASGELLPADATSLSINLANQLWHTDKSYTAPRAALTFLYGVTVPPEGANTEYCDMRVAYETLPAEMQTTVQSLSAVHSLLHSRALTGFSEWSDADRETYKGVERPLVETHGPSGRRSLCLASHVERIVDMPEEGSRKLIDELMAHATQKERVYSHKWEAGDLLIWDNRCTMHRATPFEADLHARDMRSIRTVDRDDPCGQ